MKKRVNSETKIRVRSDCILSLKKLDPQLKKILNDVMLSTNVLCVPVSFWCIRFNKCRHCNDRGLRKSNSSSVISEIAREKKLLKSYIKIPSPKKHFVYLEET
jgi:hypothetical protein